MKLMIIASPGKGGYDFWGCSGFKEGCKATHENKNINPYFDKSKLLLLI